MNGNPNPNLGFVKARAVIGEDPLALGEGGGVRGGGIAAVRRDLFLDAAASSV